MIRAAFERLPDEMAFFDERIEPGLAERLHAVAEAEFVRMTYTEAVALLEKAATLLNILSAGASICRASTSASSPKRS